jgi:outer membrane protein assembly factor BamD (BamD/ComL family)
MARALPRSALGLALAPALLLACCGCQTDGSSVLTRWRTALDGSLTRGVSKSDDTDEGSLLTRWISPKKAKPTDPNAPSPALVLGAGGWTPKKVEPNPQADAEFQAAEKLFQQGNFEEAEPAFAKIAKKRKNTPWGEKAQFYLAETQFQRGRLVAAHTSYEELHATYPGSQYLEKLVVREYAIGQKWLAVYDPNAKPDEKMSWHDRFTGGRPLIDTNGNALSVLEHVRHNDPTGPLADDAVLQIADHHFKNRDYESAGMYYDQLTKDHPKSPYLQRAQLASVDSKLKGYLGPDYDGTGLEEAREMVKQTMMMFPERQASTEGALYHTLDLITDQQAERAYHRGAYYRRTGHVAAAEYYFAMIPYRWPKSSWSAKAKTQLAELAKMPRTESLPSKLMNRSVSDPFGGGAFGNGGGGVNGMGGMGMGGMGMGGMGMPGGMGMN